MSDVLRFNVGGVLYVTTRTTLEQDSENFLLRIISGKIPSSKIGDAFFIDRSGSLFEHVLNYLRNVRTWTPPRNVDLPGLIGEADFYLLLGMKKTLEEIFFPLEDKYREFRRIYPTLIMETSQHEKYWRRIGSKSREYQRLIGMIFEG